MISETNIVETLDLTKIYKLRGKKVKIKALDNINISIKEGEIFGLLGPNGAGKTTMIQILTTAIQPTSGYATIDGINILKDPLNAKSRIALMLGSQMIYYRITGYDNLKFFCKIYRVPNYKEKIYNMAEQFGLENWLDQLVEKYSSGMKMKLALCRTLLLNRKLLLLDEPSLGLDVKLKKYLIEKLKNVDSTIILTSHDMSFVEKLCDRIGFINQGKITKIGTKEDIAKVMQSKIQFEISIIHKIKELKKDLCNHNYIKELNESSHGLMVTIESRKYFKNLLSVLGNYDVLTLKEQELTLEDLFIDLI